MAVNGTLVDDAAARKLKEAGILRVSMSIDGKGAAEPRCLQGRSRLIRRGHAGSRHVAGVGLPFQINTTVTRLNADDLGAIYDLVRSMGAVAWHVFLLVPVGRGEGLKGEELNAAMYEEVLGRLYEREEEGLIEMKVTCAPHYYRIVKERGGMPKSAGCLAGKSFLFISHRGIAQPCGYLELPCGDVRKEGVQKVWEGSPQLAAIRDLAPTRANAGDAGTCASAAGAGRGRQN